MKTKLIVLVLSAAIFGSSTAALARGGEGRRFEESRVQQTHQREWRGERHQAKGHSRAHRQDRHARTHRAYRGHQRHQHRDHGWSQQSRGRVIGHAYSPVLPHQLLGNRLSIIFSGDF